MPIIRHDLVQPIEDYRRQHSAAPLDGPADTALGVDLRDIVALLRQNFVRLAFFTPAYDLARSQIMCGRPSIP